jgi:glyoxylase-like metal-dependent hydrolase (beta-lactamase superfamily II)
MLIYEKLETNIFLVKSNFPFGPVCNGILIKNTENSGDILIDCNFNVDEIKDLMVGLKNEIGAYFASHTHLDHISNINIYEEFGVKIYCSIPEDRYLKDIDIFIRENGMVDFGVDSIFRKIIYEETNFKNLTEVNSLEPYSTFNYGNIILETMPIPGHSPGQTAYLISYKNSTKKKVLFVSDIGIERAGPWYGLKHSSLKEFRSSLKRVEILSLKNNGDDIILTSSHGEAFFTKQPEIFKNALTKIKNNEEKVLSLFNAEESKSLSEIVLKGTFYPNKHIANLPSDMRKIHECWESYIMLHHINELIDKCKLRVEDPEQRAYILN